MSARTRPVPLIEVEDLHVTYPNGYQALHGLGLRVETDERLAVVGPSGCGKSTLLKALLGLLPTGSTVSGQVQVMGVDMVRGSAEDIRQARGRLVGYVAQDPYGACDPFRTVGHHIRAPWIMHGLTPPPGVAGTELEGVGMADGAARARQYPHQFSGGMLQRASIVAGAAHQPGVLLADEPTSALDRDLADGVLGLLDDRTRALVLVTHDLALAAAHCRRAVVLNGGVMVDEGPTTTLLRGGEQTHPVTRALVAALPEGAVDPAPACAATVVAGPAVLQVEGVCHAYQHQVLTDLDLEVRAGEVVGIEGPSGCGKSTLLRILAGTETPDTGRVGFAAADGTWRSSPPPGFVMPVFQDPVASLSPHWPLWASLAEPLRARGERRSRAAWRAFAAEQLDRVGLGALDPDLRPHQISVGQAQRVTVVRALVANPRLVVADEPTASLDVLNARLVCELLAVAAGEGAAVVMVSHDGPRLRTLAQRIVTLRNGRLDGADS